MTRSVSAALALMVTGLMVPLVRAQALPQVQPHQHHHHHPMLNPAPSAGPAGGDHSAHVHAVGPAGSTYDLRWIDAMVPHHTGALRMSEVVFDIGAPGVGALGKEIWREQAAEIKAMAQWRKAWYPDAPVYPVTLKQGGDPDAMADLRRMGTAQIQAMQMLGSTPNRHNRVTWFLEGMVAHHGGALVMAHDAFAKSTNPTVRRLAASIIAAQRREIIQLRKMLMHDGFNKPEYYKYDALFAVPTSAAWVQHRPGDPEG